MMADLVARLFVVVFLVVYIGFIIGLLSWSLGSGWKTLLRESWPARLLARLRPSHLFNRTRHVN